MLANMSIIITYAQTCYSEAQKRLDYSLASRPALRILPEMKDKARLESGIIEVYINGHPVEAYRKDYPEALTAKAALRKKGKVSVIVRSRYIKEHYLQNSGTTMCFIDGEDESGEISLAIMPELYEKVRNRIKKNVIYYAEGNITNRDSVRVTRLLQLD